MGQYKNEFWFFFLSPPFSMHIQLIFFFHLPTLVSFPIIFSSGQNCFFSPLFSFFAPLSLYYRNHVDWQIMGMAWRAARARWVIDISFIKEWNFRSVFYIYCILARSKHEGGGCIGWMVWMGRPNTQHPEKTRAS